MVRIKKYMLNGLLAAAVFFASTEKASSGAQIFGIGGFSDDAFNTAIVGILSSIESLNQIANSNTAKTLGHTKELAEKLEKTVKKIDRMYAMYSKTKKVVEMGAMSVSIFSDFMELVKHIYDNEELLAIEEVEMLCHLLDYVVFDAVAASQSSVSQEASAVGGGALKNLTDMFDWIKEERDDAVSFTELDRKVSETYLKLTRISRDLRLMRRYTYGYMVAKRYRRGAYDNREYVQYVYYSKYRGMAVK
jgi:DNA-binding protein YbaB